MEEGGTASPLEPHERLQRHRQHRRSTSVRPRRDVHGGCSCLTASGCVLWRAGGRPTFRLASAQAFVAARVNLLRLADDEAILHKLADVLAWGAEGETSQSTSSPEHRRHARRGPRGRGGVAAPARLLPASRVHGRGVCQHQPVQRQGPRRREFAIEISLTSFGSSQILPLQHFSTEAAALQQRETPMLADRVRRVWCRGAEPRQASEGRSMVPGAAVVAAVAADPAEARYQARCCGAVRLLHRVRMGSHRF